MERFLTANVHLLESVAEPGFVAVVPIPYGVAKGKSVHGRFSENLYVKTKESGLLSGQGRVHLAIQQISHSVLKKKNTL